MINENIPSHVFDNHESVSSSNLFSVGYHADSMTLEVQFTSGDIYRYFGVPVEHYIGMLQAESVGKYLYKNIRGKFLHRHAFRRVCIDGQITFEAIAPREVPTDGI